MYEKHHRPFTHDRILYLQPETIQSVIELLKQNISKPVIGRLLRLTRIQIMAIRRVHLPDLDRSAVFVDDLGTGPYETCRRCGKRVRVPCIDCAVWAMGGGTGT